MFQGDLNIYDALSTPLDQGNVSFLTGDFYRESDDVVRGVTLAASSDAVFGHANEAWKNGFELDAELGCGQHFGKGVGEANATFGQIAPNTFCCEEPISYIHCDVRFEEGLSPPEVPTDSYFGLSATSLVIDDAAPVAIANHLIDFLNSGVKGSVNKVNVNKFSISAEVSIEDPYTLSVGHCVLKARVYQQDSACAVEFQRSSGECFAFNDFYRKVTQYLSSRTSLRASK